MWLLNNKISLRNSGILREFTDWHSHILPGVDDGVKTIEESLKILEEMESLGVKRIWLTPHIMEDYPNETLELKVKYEELKRHWKGNVEILLASENMLDSLFEERLTKNDFLPIGENRRHLLIETSYYNPPYGMKEMIEGAKKAGYGLILAHPERYRYMSDNDYLNLKNQGLLFQLNIISLAGGYGEQAKKRAEWLIKNGMIDLMGSDIHKEDTFSALIDREINRKKHLSHLNLINNLIL